MALQSALRTKKAGAGVAVGGGSFLDRAKSQIKPAAPLPEPKVETDEERRKKRGRKRLITGF
jgi:alcohol dehydrogenase class IV